MLRGEVHGPSSGEPVVLLHGFPELGYSWRHQVPALAEAGYRVAVPDLRGYGCSDAPRDVESYDAVRLTGDVAAIVDALGVRQAVLIGHDWGADLAWKAALMIGDRVRAVAALSVPFLPHAPSPPLALLREHAGDDHYIVFFQEQGAAETALGRDVRRTIATTRQWSRAWAAERDDHPPTPRFMSDAELGVYVEAFKRTGFTGGLNWYRNLDRNWELLAPFRDRAIEQPACFITGERDPVRQFMPASLMAGHVRDLRAEVVVEGAGHWVNQEAPEPVNAALLAFLNQLTATT